MVLQIHGEPEKEINWSTSSEFLDKKKMARVSPPAVYFVQECRPYAINWALCYLWCGIRTQWFSARCWIDNNDPANLGGNYMSIREGVRMACNEFNKYVDSSMVTEQNELEKCYSELVAFAKNENPSGSDPIVNPPKPMPLPPKEEPKPEPTKQEPLPIPDKAPGKGIAWNKILAIVLPLLIFGSGFLPPPFNGLIKLVLQAINSMFN